MVDFVKFKKQKESPDGVPRPKKRRFTFSFKRIFLWFLAFFILSSIISSITLSMTPKIAVVPITGVIMTSDSSGSILSGSGGTNSREISEILYGILDDDSIKAVVLDINSPGGSPVASEEISRAIDTVREAGIPVHAVINDVGASGAFWIAMSADKIYASKMSTVGSIGVTSAGLSFEDFIRNYNITYRKQTAGEFKDMGSPYRKPTKAEEEKIQVILDEVHYEFINHVAKSRNLSYSYVEEFATGEIFLGSFALKNGFIDEIGYYKDVVDKLREEVGENSMIMDYGPTKTIFDQLGIKSLFNFGTNVNGQVMLQ